MTLKTKVAVCVVGLLASFAGGRYSVQVNTSKTDSVTKDKETDVVIDKHKETTIVEETTPQGSKKKTTTITEDTDATKRKTDKSIATRAETATIVPRKTLNLSALVAADTSNLTHFGPIYGLSVTKEVLGPVTVGAFGLTNGVVGVSVGLNF